MMLYQKEFVFQLWLAGGIKFGDFKLKDGSRSSYFINIANVITADGETASKIGAIYADAVWRALSGKFDFIFGPAYKGIPLALLVAEKLWERHGLKKRWGYNRKEKKQYGDISEENIIGDLRDGDRVLIVDDVITSGRTKLEQLEQWEFLRRDVEVVAVFVGVDRRKEKEIGNVFSIVDSREMFKYLLSQNLISEEVFKFY
jgi:orotate phosphoribosyltransferase